MNLKTKKNKTYLSFFFSFIVLFASCSQYETLESNDTKGSDHLLRKGYGDDRYFTDAQLDQIATWHNKFAEDAILAVDATSPTVEQDIRSEMTNFTLPDFPKNNLIQYYDSIDNIDINLIKTNYTPEVADFFGRMEVVINNASNYNSIETGFNQIEADAKRELKGTNIDMVLVMLKVGKKSAKLWMPTNIGGNGIGDDFSKTVAVTANRQAPGWAVIMIHDMFGALEGVSGWVLSLLIAGGPVTLGGYLVAIGFGAAVASIKAAM